MLARSGEWRRLPVNSADELALIAPRRRRFLLGSSRLLAKCAILPFFGQGLNIPYHNSIYIILTRREIYVSLFV